MSEDLFILADLLVFRDNAADYVEAGFKKTLRMGDGGDKCGLYKDRNKLYMVTDLNSIKKGWVTLEIKSGNGPWKAVDRL